MGSAAAAVLIRERHIVDAFQRAGAISPERALAPEDLGVHTHGVGWRRLRNRAVVREAGDGSGRYYLDEEVWQAVRRTRVRLMLVVAALLVIVALGEFVRLRGNRRWTRPQEA